MAGLVGTAKTYLQTQLCFWSDRATALTVWVSKGLLSYSLNIKGTFWAPASTCRENPVREFECSPKNNSVFWDFNRRLSVPALDNGKSQWLWRSYSYCCALYGLKNTVHVLFEETVVTTWFQCFNRLQRVWNPFLVCGLLIWVGRTSQREGVWPYLMLMLWSYNVGEKSFLFLS